MLPKDEIKYLDMSFEEASRFIVSAGTSENKNNNQGGAAVSDQPAAPTSDTPS